MVDGVLVIAWLSTEGWKHATTQGSLAPCMCRLTAVHLACIYIAAKNVEFVPYKRLLSTMLSHIYNGEPPQDAAPQLELEVLHALEWRLGPFFRPVHAA